MSEERLAAKLEALDWQAVRRDLSLGAPAIRALFRSRLTPPINPVSTLKLGRDLAAFGPSPAIGYAPGAARHSGDIAVIDNGETFTFEETEQLTRDCNASLTEHGITNSGAVAVLGRNSLGMATAIAAIARTGADLVYLNPGFQPAQIADIISDRGITLVLVDDDLADHIPEGVTTEALNRPREWAATGKAPDGRVGTGRHIILTSVTTGKPKGGDRSRTPLEATVSLLDVLPFRQRATHVMAAPMFHSWGWLNHRMTGLLDTTEIMVPRPSAEAVLDAAHEHQAEVIVTTPVVVRRLAEAGPGDRYLSKLRGVLVSGSAIPAPVVESFQDQFGPTLYNLYGSTEVGFATCASPQDLLAASDTAGQVLPGVEVVILDPSGEQVPNGSEGEVWVGSAVSFDGYIDGGDKDRLDNLLSTGDLGYFDEAGRLFICGRADDLIISGGENVHPSEVESVLRKHDGVSDVAAVGRQDPVFGQAVVAHVVPTADADRESLIEEIMAFSKDNLAGYQRPKEIILRDELPTNETGKVMRRKL